MKAEVTRLALCRRGMNRVAALFKEDGIAFEPLVKFDEAKGELLALGYRADGVSDTEGDFADATVVRGMAHSFMRNGAELELGHIVLGGKALTKAQAHVAESFVIQPGDPRFAGWKDEAGQPVDATNGWGLLIKIDDPELKKKYGEEGWNGVSLFAPSSQVEYLAKEEYDGRGLRRSIKESQMDEAKLTTMLDERFASLTKAITDVLKPPAKTEDKKDDKPKDEAPTLAKEDRGDPKKVREFLAAKKRYDLQKSVNWDDEKEVENYLTGTLEKASKTDAPEETPELKKAREDLAAKEREVEDLVKMSGQRPPDDKKQTATVDCGLTKAQQDLVQEGIKRAEWLNKRNGR